MVSKNCIFDREFQDCYSLRACASKEQNLLLYEGAVTNKMWSHFKQTYIAIYMILIDKLANCSLSLVLTIPGAKIAI